MKEHIFLSPLPAKSVDEQLPLEPAQRLSVTRQLRRIPLLAMTPEEEEERIVLFCQALLVQDSYSLRDAGKVAGITVREIALLRRKFPELSDFIDACKAADDLLKADMANSNLHEGLKWRGKNGEVDRAMTIYADKSRGGYSERKHIEVRSGWREIHPVDLNSIPEAEEA